MEKKIKIKLGNGAHLPHYQTSGSAGADLQTAILEPLTIAAGAWAVLPTGLYLEIPDGYEVQIRPRSGLALHHGVTVLNSPGTIDSDYRGELQVILINHGKAPYTVHPGDRIAQMVVAQAQRASFEIVETLSTSARGEGGFGHTGQ